MSEFRDKSNLSRFNNMQSNLQRWQVTETKYNVKMLHYFHTVRDSSFPGGYRTFSICTVTESERRLFCSMQRLIFMPAKPHL